MVAHVHLHNTVDVVPALYQNRAFQSPDFHYFLAVQRSGTSFRISLQEVREGRPRTLAGETVTLPASHVVLGMEQAGARLGFYYEPESGARTWLIRNVDARLLSTQVAGGFVGATIGIHARRE